MGRKDKDERYDYSRAFINQPTEKKKQERAEFAVQYINLLASTNYARRHRLTPRQFGRLKNCSQSTVSRNAGLGTLKVYIEIQDLKEQGVSDDEIIRRLLVR